MCPESIRNSAESTIFWQIPLSCGCFLSAGTEEDDCAGQDDKAEEGEAEGIGTTGGGLDGQVAGQETEAVHFPHGNAVIHKAGICRCQTPGHPDLVQHLITKRSCQFLLESG